MNVGSFQLRISSFSTPLGVGNGDPWNPKFSSLLRGRRWSPNPGALKLVALASSSSIAGSGPEYSEGLLDGVWKRRKKNIAGVDQDELMENPELLADPDSCFCEFNGVKIHHKVSDAAVSGRGESSCQSEKMNIPMILLHGFGASLFSWNRALKPLAEATCSRVLAFDRPAFGLTSRVEPTSAKVPAGDKDAKPLNPYSMAFSVLTTLYFVNSLAADRAVLVGHSAGSLVAVNTYFEAPERVAALILVAPAIFAPNPSRKENQLEDEEKAVDNNLISSLGKLFSNIAKTIAEVIGRMVTGMATMLSSIYKRVLSSILRSALGLMLVRMVIDKFGISAVKIAWHDPKKVTDHVLRGYTKPLRSKGWDRALVEYTAAMLLDTNSELKPPLGKRLHEISCPVLIITGDNDRIVPSWNARKLSRAIPGSVLEVIKHCGHLPHEEKVEEFVLVVRKFLQSVLGGSEEQLSVRAIA